MQKIQHGRGVNKVYCKEKYNVGVVSNSGSGAMQKQYALTCIHNPTAEMAFLAPRQNFHYMRQMSVCPSDVF